MSDTDFVVILTGVAFLWIVAICAADQKRKYRERASMCDALARALRRVPNYHDAGASWLAEEIQKELTRAGWEPFP